MAADIQLNSLCYYKTEIDNINTTETTRVNTELSKKLDTTSLGSPSGVATLDPSGKVNSTQMPFSTFDQANDIANNNSAMTPERVDYRIKQNIMIYPIVEASLTQTVKTLVLTTTAQAITYYASYRNTNAITDSVAGTMTLTHAGRYRVNVFIDGVSDVANRTVSLEIRKGSNVVAQFGFATNIGLSNRGSGSFIYDVDGLVGDVYSLYIVGDGTLNYTTTGIQISLVSLKVTQ